MGTTAEQQRTQYWQRKLNGQCTECAAPLDDDDNCKCADCAAQDRLYKSRYYRSPGGRKRARDSMRRRYHADPKKAAEKREKVRALYHAKRVAGICTKCDRLARVGKSTCELHATGGRARRPLLRKPSLRADAYQPIDELEQNMRVRVLRALYWLTHNREWCSASEMLQSARIEQTSARGGSQERNRAEVMLRRLVKTGFAERIGERGTLLFRIADAGLAEVRRYREGDLPSWRGRRAA